MIMRSHELSRQDSSPSPQSSEQGGRGLPSEFNYTPPRANHAPDVPFQDAGNYLRTQLNIPPGQPVNLDALPDPPPGERPSQALPVLIKLAIYGSERKKLTLMEIYKAIETRFPYYRDMADKKPWRVCASVCLCGSTLF